MHSMRELRQSRVAEYRLRAAQQPLDGYAHTAASRNPFRHEERYKPERVPRYLPGVHSAATALLTRRESVEPGGNALAFEQPT
jgi:hypothetical protein